MTGILVAVMAAITLASVAGTGLAQAQTNALTDRAALVALYNATDGPNWANRADRLSGQPIGDWYGIVTDDSGRTYTLQRARTYTLQRAHLHAPAGSWTCRPEASASPGPCWAGTWR